MIGTTVSHYRILERLGGGGMGIVYKAEDTHLKRTVALKFLPPSLSTDPEARERFVREAQAASALDHPNICTIHEIGENDGQMFIVMGYYEGKTLKERIQEARDARDSTSQNSLQAGIAVPEALDIAIQVCQGLSRAHEAGIVHRDIKPANIIITTRGEVRILDFGLAKLSSQTMLTRTGSTLGTAAYMSPEQARGDQVDHRSDIWSLGVVLYEMLGGRTPFKSDYEQALIYSILNENPPLLRSLNPAIPEVVEQIVQRAMAKELAERYQHTAEFLSDLKIARGLGDMAGTPSATLALKASLKQRTIRIWAFTAGALVLAAAAYFIGRALYEGKAPGSPKSISVISFENQTGLDSLDYLRTAIPNLLITSLEQSPYLRVTTWDRLFALLKQAKKQGVEYIDRTLGAELSSMDGAEAMVVGTIARAGDLYLTNLKVINPMTKQTIATVTAKGKGVESLIDTQVDELSREISKGLGLSGRSLDEGRRPIASVTTSSLDAYRQFLRGKEIFLNFSGNPAPAFERATKLDSSFATAYLYLALAGYNFGETDTSRALITKARSLAWKTPEKERLLIEAHYAAWIEKDLPKAVSVLEEVTTRFPAEIEAYRWIDQLSVRMRRPDSARIASLTKIIELDPEDAASTFFLAYVHARSGETGKAYQLASRYRDLRPDDANPWDVLGDIYLWLGKPDSALVSYAKAGNIDSGWNKGWKPALAHALAERYDEALKLLEAGLNEKDPELRGAYHYWRCFLHYWTGRYREASRNIAAMRRQARTPEEKSWLSDMVAVNGYIAEDAGRLKGARESIDESYRMSEQTNPRYSRYNDPTYRLFTVLLDIKEGRLDSARSHCSSLHAWMTSRKAFGKRTFTVYWYHLMRAEILLAADSAAYAIREFGLPVDTLRLVMPNPAEIKTLQLYNLPNQRDVIPRAYLKTGDVRKAIQGYEALTRIDPAAQDRRLINPIFHFRLARLYEQTGEKGKAIAAYTRFLEVWKNADRDAPFVGEASRSLALFKGER